jgi:hypothetical protein
MSLAWSVLINHMTCLGMQAFIALSHMDADAAWCQLTAAAAAMKVIDPLVDTIQLKSGPLRLLDVRQRIVQDELGTFVPAGLQTCNRSKLAAICGQVERYVPMWHRQVEATLERL